MATLFQGKQLCHFHFSSPVQKIQEELLHYPCIGGSLGEILKFYIKFFVWAKPCQASYPIHEQDLLTNLYRKSYCTTPSNISVSVYIIKG